MIIQTMQTPRKSIFAGTDIKVRQIELSPEVRRLLLASKEYDRLYPTLTDEEYREMPEGVAISATGLFRTVSGCGARDHKQLIHYKQPILDDYTTDAYIKWIINTPTYGNPDMENLIKYIKDRQMAIYSYFPLAFQIAYDIATTGNLTERTYELVDRFDRRFAAIMETIE
jgi:hypothetical protein